MADFSMSKAQVNALRERAERMISKAKNIAEKSDEAIGQVVQSMEINGAAFAAGFAKGRFGNVDVMGVPVDLGTGFAGHLVAFFGGGRFKRDLHNLADGVLASYSTTVGAGIGQRMAREALAARGGTLPAGGTGALPGATAAGDAMAGAQRLTREEDEALRAAGLRR